MDALELDQFFFHDIVDSSEDAGVVSAVIGIGKRLKRRAIAERAETNEQLVFLQARGCEEGQEYYFSRPVVARQFSKLHETRISATVWN